MNPRYNSSELEQFMTRNESIRDLTIEIMNEWVNKASIYADMLFAMDQHDFIDFMTGGMAYCTGALSAMIFLTDPNGTFHGNVCIDPNILTADAMKFAGAAIFFDALHMLYRYNDNKYALEAANRNIDHATDKMMNVAARRYTLFSEAYESYVSSAVESARKFIGM